MNLEMVITSLAQFSHLLAGVTITFKTNNSMDFHGTKEPANAASREWKKASSSSIWISFQVSYNGESLLNQKLISKNL